MKKKLLALLLCLTMLLVMLPTVAMAEGEGGAEPTANNTYASLSFRKAVTLNGTTTLPEETFEFKFEDKAVDPQLLENYGINASNIQVPTSQLGPDTANANVFFVDYNTRIEIDLSKVTTENGWTQSSGSDNNTTVYRKSVSFSEVPGNSAGWSYDSTKYTLDFIYTYNIQTRVGSMDCHAGNGSETSGGQGIKFDNTYTANNSSIVIIVPETTEPEVTPNPTTGAAPANLGLGCVVIGLAAMGAVAYARKK